MLRHTDAFRRAICIALLLIGVSIGHIVNAQSDDVPTTAPAGDEPVDWLTFNGEFYQNSATDIIKFLTPCGCAAITTVTPLRDIVTPKDPIDEFILMKAEQALLQLAMDLMTRCGCEDGVTLLRQSLTQVPEPSSDNTVVKRAQASVMSFRVSNVVNKVILACCDASKSPRRFSFINGAYNYADAVADAKARGGSVAVLKTRNDCFKAASYLRDRTSDPINGLMFSWLGMQFNDKEWHWVDGTALSSTNDFTNWAKDQPERGKSCAGYVITAHYGVFSTWYALACDAKLPYLLELPPDASGGGGGFAMNQIVIVSIIVLLVLFVLAIVAVLARRFIPRLRPSNDGNAAPAAGANGGGRTGPYQRRRLTERRGTRRAGHGDRAGRDDDGEAVEGVAVEQDVEMTDVHRSDSGGQGEGASPSGAMRHRRVGARRAHIVFHQREDGSSTPRSAGSATPTVNGSFTGGAAARRPAGVAASGGPPAIVSPTRPVVVPPSALRRQLQQDALRYSPTEGQQPPTESSRSGAVVMGAPLVSETPVTPPSNGLEEDGANEAFGAPPMEPLDGVDMNRNASNVSDYSRKSQ